MRPQDRHREIIERLRTHERASVGELAELFTTSHETIRRDIAVLVRQGLANKYHGGVALPVGNGQENAFQTRMHEHAAEKRAVAQHAAGLFSPGDSLFVDTGTTTLFFAKALASLSQLTIITNSLLIAQALSESDNRVFIIGGEYRAEAEENLGALALEQVLRFNSEHAVITVGALNLGGAMDFLVEEAEMARTMIDQARYLTVIADSSKLGRRALFQVFPLSRIDRLVTDTLPEGELLEALHQAQVEICVAPN